MKNLSAFLLLLFLAHELSAQEKKPVLESTWEGTYGNNEKNNPYFYSFQILPGGQMKVVNQNKKILAEGTYVFKDPDVTIVYRYIKDVIQYECTGKLDRPSGTLSGIWRRLQDAGTSNRFTQNGNWIMKRAGANTFNNNAIDTSLLTYLINKKNNGLSANKNFYNLSGIKLCTDYPPVASRLLPPRTATNYRTHYKIDENGNIGEVAFIRQPLAGYTEKMWEPGQEITVAFDIIGGSIDLIDKVKFYAKEWEQYANIKIVYANEFATAFIRVGFKPGGSNSYIGRDALLIDPAKTTMNFGWLATTSDERFIKQVILHEFGHALGFVHEHQTFGTAIPWDKEKVYAYYALPPNSWTKEQVDQNIFYKFSYSTTNYSSFDPQSIMQYPVPAELTTDSSSIAWNLELSNLDKQYATLFYPFPTPPPNATGTLRTGDDCDEIAFLIEYGVAPADKVEFVLELGQNNGKAVSWWKQVGIPLTNGTNALAAVQNHSLIPSENRTTVTGQIAIEQIDKTKGISFWKAKAFGAHTPLNYKWNVLPAIYGGCRIRLTWKKDSCL